MFKKNSLKWSIMAVLLLAVGFIFLNRAKGPDIKINKPQVDVPVDLAMEEFAQQQVDQGHSPWRLDPIQTTITFVSLKISPKGIIGPFPIKEKDVKIVQETDRMAVVEISGGKTPIKRVYLQRLIRQDRTGIWSVVGYDPKEKLSIIF